MNWRYIERLELEVDHLVSEGSANHPTQPGHSGLQQEVRRRRTFAIISHPDAGKTTLTEKFLLYAGCIDVAGTVRGRKTRRAVTSDWMELERERGISITSTVLSFEYQGHLVNLLDTPGHQDFSEDTYRTLAAADSAVMVIDAAKGIETQTRKLFKVCAVRGIPILTFINKMDRMGRSPLDLLHELETVLGIDAVPLNWPLGQGPEFSGVFDLAHNHALVFDPTRRGDLQVVGRVHSREELPDHLPAGIVRPALDELDLLDGAGAVFDEGRFLQGRMTPVFFGSAMTNFGVQPFLEAFLRLAPCPRPRRSDQGMIPPEREAFSGIVFKIQANLNPKHRDRVAFVRVCSGAFTEDTEPVVSRTGARLRIKGSHRMFAREREEVVEAYPGDIIGLAVTGSLRLGDTLCEGAPFVYEGLPQFSPERFAVIRCMDNSRRKQLAEGLQQLADEGAVQVFFDPVNPREPILAAIGELQFDVVRFRLESEYGVRSEIEVLPYHAAGWLSGEVASESRVSGTRRVQDHHGRTAVLAESDWNLQWLQTQNPGLRIRAFSEDLFVPQD